MDVPACGDLIDDRYRLDEVLGEGASAWVFRALDKRAQRNVALKIVKREGAEYPPDVLRRFEREVRIIANLQDPHTVTLYGSGRTSSGHLYMVFELVEGMDLAQLIVERTRLLPYEVVDILEQMLSSLREAHRNGLLHRDIKPENVRVSRTKDNDLKVKLLDFGIARSEDPEAASITRAGEIVGTPRYMAPEAFMESHLTAAADVYSVGIVAMEMLFGRDALHGNDWGEQYERLITGHVFIFEGMDAIPDELMDVIEKMTHQKPDKRYQTAEAALRALREVRELLDEPIDTVDENVQVSDALTVPHVPRTERRRRRPSRRPATTRSPRPVERGGVPVRVVVLVASALALLTAVAFVWFASRTEEKAAPRIPRDLLLSSPAREPVRPPPAPDAGVEAEPAVAVQKSGCGLELPPRGLVEETMLGTQKVSWKTRIPKNYSPDKPHPIVIMFHHDDDDGADMLKDTRFGPIADRYGVVVVGFNAGSNRRAWENPAETDGVLPMLDQTAAQLCIDRRRVFLLGHGSGSHAVEALSCAPWVTAVATSAYLPLEPRFACNPAPPRPAIHIAPTGTRHVPIGGGLGCMAVGDAEMISLAMFEGMWRERNGCSEDEPVTTEHTDGACRAFSCNTAFTTCQNNGGFGWPGTKRRKWSKDPARCDGEPSQFPSAKVIWDFFAAAPPLPET